MHAVRLIKVVPHTCFFSLGNSLPSPRGGREYYARFTLPDRAPYRRASHRLVGIVRFVSSVHPYLSKSSVSDRPPIHEDGQACDSLHRRSFIPYSFFKDSVVRIRTGIVSASGSGIIRSWYSRVYRPNPEESLKNCVDNRFGYKRKTGRRRPSFTSGSLRLPRFA